MSRTTDPGSPAVLITGASTGIGAACALDLDGRNFRVFAGVRSEADGRRLRGRASQRLSPVLIDVTDTASIQSTARTVSAAVGQKGLAGLVNNAGIFVPGPLEFLPLDQFRKQLEVNLIGNLAVTQAVLPLLRAATGRIVNMGSICGKIAPPYMGAYATSKFALEALTDVLRVELRKWRICVSIVEPDNVATPIWDKIRATADQLSQHFPPEARQLYETGFARMRRATRKMGETGMPVRRVVRAVRHALCASRPKARYPIGWRTRLAVWAFSRVPVRVRDWLVLRQLGMS